MPNKVILAIIVSGLLISGFFYFQIIKEKPEPFYSEREEIKTAKDAAEEGEVLGQETKESELATEAEKEALEQREVRGFEGCRQDQVNINIAFEEGLKELQGIGPVLAQRIIAERQQGLFYSLSDLVRVSGIGEGIAANIKEQDFACAGALDEGLDSLPREQEKDDAELAMQEEKERDFAGCEDGQININSASKELLQEIVQIGSSRAEQIVQLRQEVPFYSLEDLGLISGIAEGIISQIKEQGLACADHPDQTFFIEPDSEPDPESESESKPKSEPESAPDFEGCEDGQINLNSASKEDLVEITQIGSAYANQIIELRKEELFWSVNDLDRVSGIALGGSRLGAIIEQDLACAADADDTSFEPFKPPSSLSGKTPASKNEKDEEEKEEEATEEKKQNLCPVDINTASLEELQVIIGIGPVLAQRIIEARSFCSLYELIQVSGIGEITLQKIIDQNCAYIENCLDDGDPPADSDKEKEDGCEPNSININTAPQEELEKIAHITSSRAEEIISLREDALFSSVDDLNRVFGIGGSRVADIKEQGCAYVDVKKENENGGENGEDLEPEPEPDPDSEPDFQGCKDGQINLNSASKEELMEITQIGSAYANQIIELRKEELFWSVNDLDRVSGIALGGSRLGAIIEQGLACAADPN